MSEAVRLPGVAVTVVILRYEGGDAIDALMPEHMAWLNAGYAKGIVLASGRMSPWTGGVLLCRGDRAAAEALMADAPLVVAGGAAVEYVSFVTGLAAPGLAALLR